MSSHYADADGLDDKWQKAQIGQSNLNIISNSAVLVSMILFQGLYFNAFDKQFGFTFESLQKKLWPCSVVAEQLIKNLELLSPGLTEIPDETDENGDPQKKPIQTMLHNKMQNDKRLIRANLKKKRTSKNHYLSLTKITAWGQRHKAPLKPYYILIAGEGETGFLPGEKRRKQNTPSTPDGAGGSPCAPGKDKGKAKEYSNIYATTNYLPPDMTDDEKKQAVAAREAFGKEPPNGEWPMEDLQKFYDDTRAEQRKKVLTMTASDNLKVYHYLKEV